MTKSNSGYFPLKMLCKSAPQDCLFGPTTYKNEHDCIYPKKSIPLNSTVIWLPKQHKTVALTSYLDAQANGDQEAIAKIQELGIPLGINFNC